MKSLSIGLFILLACSSLHAKDIFKGLSIGVTGGYSNYQTFTCEEFLQFNLNFGGRAFEPKTGLSYHRLTTQYDYLDNLKMENIGFFYEATIFPFRKYLFAGIRVEAPNVYWLTNQSMDRVNETSYDIYNIFWGFGLNGIIGLNMSLGKRVSFRMYTMFGIRTLRMSDGHPLANTSTYTEFYSKFVFQANAGLVVKLFNSKK